RTREKNARTAPFECWQRVHPLAVEPRHGQAHRDACSTQVGQEVELVEHLARGSPARTVDLEEITTARRLHRVDIVHAAHEEPAVDRRPDGIVAEDLLFYLRGRGDRVR